MVKKTQYLSNKCLAIEQGVPRIQILVRDGDFVLLVRVFVKFLLRNAFKEVNERGFVVGVSVC
jgi:hypothetical protein